ncbi:MAG: GyrI-like domain-containing protein [Thermoleophilia bacterium]
MEHRIETKEIPAQLALTVRKRVSLATIAQGMGEAFGAILAHAQAGGGQFAGPPFCLYPDPPGGEFGLLLCMPVAPGATAGEGIALEEVPGGLVAATLHKGPYSALRESYGALEAWMAVNGKHPAGPPREVYLNDPMSVPENELLTEIDWPIA